MPPRESWRIVQREGLITYWTHEYHPETLPTRYLPPSNGGPLVTRYYNTRVPYRTGALGSRYLAQRNYPYRVTYQPNHVTRHRVATSHTPYDQAEKRVVRTSRLDSMPAGPASTGVKETARIQIDTTPPAVSSRPDALDRKSVV